jgi:hypothetical protein
VLLLMPENRADLRVAAGLLGGALGVTLLAKFAGRRR